MEGGKNMRLKVMNCQNCNAPLHLEGEKLVCAFCGGSFDITKDASDVEYEKTVNAETYIRQSLMETTSQLQEYYQRKEEEKIQDEEKAREAERKKVQDKRKKKLLSWIRSFIIIALLSIGIIVIVQYLSKRANDMKAEEKARKARQAAEATTFRVTGSELMTEPETMAEVYGMICQFEIDEYSETIYDMEDEWALKTEPEVIRSCLITSDEDNSLYSIVKIILSTDDGREKELYQCVVVPNIKVDRKGEVFLPDMSELQSRTASDYDPIWGAGFDPELLEEEVIRVKKEDSNNGFPLYYDL